MKIKTYNEETNKYDEISPWSSCDVKMHPHILSENDLLWSKKCKLIACGDTLIGFQDGNTYLHCGYNDNINLAKNTKVLATYTGNDVWSETKYIHCATNGVDTVIGTCYGNNKVRIVKKVNGIWTASSVIPKLSDSLILGCGYRNGVWYVISTTNVFFSNNLTSWNSIVLTVASVEQLKDVRDNDMVMCEYGDYAYLFGYGNGVGITIKISKKNNTIVDTFSVADSNYINTKAIVKLRLGDIGSLPVLVYKSKTADTLSFTILNITTTEFVPYQTYNTGIYCYDDFYFAGFDMGQQQLSFVLKIQNPDSIRNNVHEITARYVKFKTKGYGTTLSFSCNHKIIFVNPILNADYFGAVFCSEGDDINYIYSTVNGIDWHKNLGFLYTEDVSKKKIDVTELISSNIVKENNVYTGIGLIKNATDVYDFNIPPNITPRKVIISVVSTAVEYAETNSKLYIEDDDGVNWLITSSVGRYRVYEEKTLNNTTSSSYPQYGMIYIYDYDTLFKREFSCFTNAFSLNNYYENETPVKFGKNQKSFSIKKPSSIRDSTNGSSYGNIYPLVVKWMVIAK